MSLIQSELWTILSSIGSILSGVFTTLIFIGGWIQIRKYIRLSELDVYYKLKNDFNSSGCDKLIQTINSRKLQVKNGVNGYPYLVEQHNEHIVDGENHKLSNELLGHIEDMYMFFEKELITKELLISGYGNYIELTYNSIEIKDYIQRIRGYYNNHQLYSGLEKLYNIVSNG
jgi:hypothetical protein